VYYTGIDRVGTVVAGRGAKGACDPRGTVQGAAFGGAKYGILNLKNGQFA